MIRLIVVVCLIAAFFYFRPVALTGLPTLADIDGQINTVRAAVPWPGKEAEEALGAERSRSAVLDSEMTSLRDKLAQAAADEASGTRALQSMQSVSQRSAEEVQSEHSRANALAVQLVELQRDAASQLDAVKKQLDDQLLRTARLERGNVMVQGQLAEAAVFKAAAELAQRSWQQEIQTSAQKTRSEHERGEALTAQLAALQRDAASQIASLQVKLDSERTLPGNLERYNSTDGKQPPREVRDEALGNRVRDTSEQSTASRTVGAERYSLPDELLMRVVVRYSRSSESARLHAINLSQILQARGVKIVEFVGAPSPIAVNRLTYFYNDDRSGATHLARILPEFRSNIYQAKLGEPIPRPGVIEIDVAV